MDIILKEKYVINKSQNKTNIIIDFSVDKDYSALLLSYNYTPKNILDYDINQKSLNDTLKEYFKNTVIAYYDSTKTEEDFSAINWQDFSPASNLVSVSIDSPLSYIGAGHRPNPTDIYTLSDEFSSRGFLKTKIHQGKWRVVLNVHAIINEIIDFDLKIVAV